MPPESMSLEKEALTLLRDTYLFFTISDSLENFSDELLVQVYLRLLHVLDPNYDLQDNTSTAVCLKHIYKSLRHLELVHLVGKASLLLDKKTFLRLCSALHDKITARYGSKSSLRIRKIVKAEELSRRRKKLADKAEPLRPDDGGRAAKENVSCPEALLGDGGGGKVAVASSRQRTHIKDSTVTCSEEQPTETTIAVVVPLKGRELARTPIRPQISDASTGNSSVCSSPNISASSVHETTQDSQSIPGSPRPVEQILLPPPLDFDDSVITRETAPPAALPITPTLEILAVNYERTGDASTAVVNIIPSGRQIARTPVTGKLSSDDQDVLHMETTSNTGENNLALAEDEGNISKSPLTSPVANTNISSHDISENISMVSKDLSDLILKPPPGFDSLLDAQQLILSPSEDESKARSPQVSKTEKIMDLNDKTYIINDTTYCASTEPQADSTNIPIYETPEKLSIFGSNKRKTYCKDNVDLSGVNRVSVEQQSAADSTFIVAPQNTENKTQHLSPECQEPHEVRETSYKFLSSFDDSGSIFSSKKPAKKKEIKKQLNRKELKLEAETAAQESSASENFITKNVIDFDVDKIEQDIKRRFHRADAEVNETKDVLKVDFPSSIIEANKKVAKRGRRKKIQAFSSEREATPIVKKAVQSAVSRSPTSVRSKRTRNTGLVNYDETSVVDPPGDGEGSSLTDELETNHEKDDAETMESCVLSPREEKVMKPSVVSENEMAVIKQKGRKQVSAENDSKHRSTRATRSKTDLRLITANEDHSNGDETVKVNENKLKNEDGHSVLDKVLKSIENVTSSEPPKIGRRRGKAHQNNMQDIIEKSVPARKKQQVRRTQATGSKTDRGSSSSSESGELKANGIEESDAFTHNEFSVQKNTRRNRGSNKKPLVSSNAASKNVNNAAEYSSPVVRKGARKTGVSTSEDEKTVRIAGKKNMTSDEDNTENDLESVSMNPSPPKRRRAAKSSCPNVNSTSNLTKPKKGNDKRTNFPIAVKIPVKRNVRIKNEASVSAAVCGLRDLPARGSKQKAKENIAADARDSVTNERSQR
ncbi:hypothetical protein FHG87_015839 [Trinorchestia longiramus]|nr:hypothetical protein FHG87_015839 [Trinorchestia longiramus]